jgi:hypothetical protein
VKALKYLLLLSIAAILSTFLPFLRSQFGFTRIPTPFADPEWKDNVWPIREQTPWDISTDYAYPRVVEFDVTEGTWLRLDVSPTGDIVFDMLGDVYCLPSAEVSAAGGTPVTARPILLGVPHDSDPHFSPAGDRIVFRSDAGLGLENIWVKPWAGCEAADLRPIGTGTPGLMLALASKTHDEHLLSQGVRETEERRVNRLIREGRYDGLPVVLRTPNVLIFHQPNA